VPAGGNVWDADVGSAFGAVSEAVTLDYTLQAQGTLSTDAAYIVDAGYFALPNTIYYYQTNQNQQGENQFRVINLSSYFSDAIVSHEMWHNFITSIDGATYAFSIFHVVTGTFNESEDYSSNNPPASSDYWHEYAYGTLTHYWLHLKINITTGQVENRKTVITKDKNYNNLAYADDGTQDVFDRRAQVGRDRVAHSTASARDNSSTRNSVVHIVSSVQDYTAGACADPWYEDLFSNCFQGDWLYQWRNLTFESADATNTNFNNVRRFLKTSFINNKWVEGFHSEMPEYWNIGDPSIPELLIYEPPQGSNLYNGIPPSSDFPTSIQAVLTTLDVTLPITYQDYFGGSVVGAPSDVNTWRRWAQGLNAGEGYKGPSFAGQLNEPPSSATTGDYATDMTRPWFSYNELDSPT